jgi:hypothetical protein
MRHRIELVSASIHWAHTEVAIELSVTATGSDRVDVEVTVSSWGNYWDNRREPRTARCRLTGTLCEGEHEHDDLGPTEDVGAVWPMETLPAPPDEMSKAMSKATSGGAPSAPAPPTPLRSFGTLQSPPALARRPRQTVRPR